MPGLGVIGCGHWGPNYLRVFASQKRTRLLAACDLDANRRQRVAEAYPQLAVFDDAEGVISHPDVDAIIIATPAVTHFDLARRALLAGKDVLCEKPLTVCPEEGDELIALAERHQQILMVGHVYLFNHGIRQLRGYIDSGRLGDIRYAYSVRSNNGPVRRDVSVLFDLASHDIAVFNYLLDAVPVDVSLSSLALRTGSPADAAFLTLRYPGNILINAHVSWIGLRKTRQLTIVGAACTAEWDELSDPGPLRLIDRVREAEPEYKDFGEFQLVSREQQITVPHVEVVEPLRAQAEHFIDCVINRRVPLCDGRRGNDVVRVLHKAESPTTSS